MIQLDLPLEEEMEPELAVPKHVALFDSLLDRYDDGVEPISNWATEDVARALQCFHRELVERDAAEQADDGQ